MGQVVSRKVPKHVRRCLIYCRVSTVEEEQNDSLDEQERVGRDHARKLGYQPHEIEVYREKFTGEMLWQRRELADLRAEVEAGRVSTVVVKKLDRIARDPIYQGLVIKEALKVGCRVEVILEPIDGSTEGELIRFIKGYASRLEIAQIKERTQSGKIKRRREGRRAGLKVYGYARDLANATLTIDPETSRVVARIYAWVAEGRSFNWIAGQLTDEGVPTPNAHLNFTRRPAPVAWQTTTLVKMVRSEIYKGEDYWGKMASCGLRDNGKSWMRPVPKADWLPVPSGVPAIVTADLWDRANAAIDSERGRQIRGDQSRNGRVPVLLRGIAFCSLCGRRLGHFTTTNRHGRSYRYYRCASSGATRVRNGGGRCGHVAVPMGWIDDLVWDRVVTLLDDREGMRATFAAQRDDDGRRAMLGRDLESLGRDLTRETRAAEALAGRLARAMAEGDEILVDAFEKTLADIKTRTRMLREKEEACRGRLAAYRTAEESLEEFEAMLDRASTLLAGSPPGPVPFEAKRLALEALGARVTASGRDVAVDFRAVPGLAAGDTTPTNSVASGKLFHFVLSRAHAMV